MAVFVPDASELPTFVTVTVYVTDAPGVSAPVGDTVFVMPMRGGVGSCTGVGDGVSPFAFGGRLGEFVEASEAIRPTGGTGEPPGNV